MQCIPQWVLLIHRLREVKHDRVSGVKLLILLVWALYQMFVGHGTQIMLLLCVKYWRITSMVKLGVLSGNKIMCKRHKKIRKSKKRNLCDFSHSFKTIGLIRKPKKRPKRRANFSNVASCQPVITPTSICMFKVNFKRTRAKCKIWSELKIEIANWCRSSVFIVNFEHISHLVPVFFLFFWLWIYQYRLGKYWNY